MKVVVAVTGASGAIYAKRLLDQLNSLKVNLHVVASANAREIMRDECDVDIEKSPGKLYDDREFKAPFLSGSHIFDAMVVIPCSMGTLGRIANGISDSVITRSADVFLKERRKLILVPRETPLHAIHLDNMARLARTGADIIPAMPSFYSKPQSIEEVVDTVVCRVLDHLGLKGLEERRWKP